MATPTMHDRNIDQAAYWNGPAGRRWMERQDTQDILLAPVSELSFDRAHPAKGERVVDIGCGCGATTIELGRRVGPTGYVLGVDVSAPMLGRARERTPADLPLEFVLADATVHSFEPGRSDLLFSRFGVMFFADPAAIICQHAQGAAERRPPGVRGLARAAAKPMDDDRAAGSVQARSAPP